MSSRKEKVAFWSAVIAALSLIVALVFNGIQVRDSAHAQHQAKVATELALLQQIQSSLTDSVYRTVPYSKQIREFRAEKSHFLSPSAYRAVAEEAENMDYFAWLFNNGYLEGDGLDELIGPQMICEYQRAINPILRDPTNEVSDLIQFMRERLAKLRRLVQVCA